MNTSLYKLDSVGRTRVWSIRVERINEQLSNIIVESGVEGGVMTPKTTPISKGSNEGKVNEKTVHDQALFDAQSEVRKKLKSGYVENKVDMNLPGFTATIGKPMKGYAYHPNPDKNNKSDKRKSLKDLKIEGERIGLSPKLDGWRARFRVNKDGVTLYSSSGDEAVLFDHIASDLQKSFGLIAEYVKESYGVDELILDGEIYRHSLQVVRNEKDVVVGFRYEDFTSGFAATAAACSTKTITPIIQELRDQMQFHIFDVDIPDYHYLDRFKIAEMFAQPSVVPLASQIFVADEEEIDRYMKSCMILGYEGLMIRTLDRPYEHKRTTQLSKYKPLMDDEFQVIGFKESIEGNTLGSLEIKISDDMTGFANVKGELGTAQKKKEIWENQKDYLNLWVTVEFMERTPDGSLRFPQAKAFRKGKSID